MARDQDKARESTAKQSSSPKTDTVHGEGNYKAAREFDEAEREFVHSDKLNDAAGKAAPKSDSERRELEAAEQRARQRAKEEDPAVLGATERAVSGDRGKQGSQDRKRIDEEQEDERLKRKQSRS